MTSGSITTTLRRPSNDPDVLRAQLLRELIALDSPPEAAPPPQNPTDSPSVQPAGQNPGSASSNPLAVEHSSRPDPAAVRPAPSLPSAPGNGDTPQPAASGEPALYHAYLQHALLIVWRGVAQGNLHLPRQMLERLRPMQRFIDRHLSRWQTRAELAAAELLFTLDCLRLADQTLDEARTSQRLADPRRSSTEREVLRVLSHNRNRYLRRGAVWEEMSSLRRPTQARVGQILADLREQGVVQRTFGRAQGNPDSSFYALSPMGIEICENIGLGQPNATTSKAASAGLVLANHAKPVPTSPAIAVSEPPPAAEGAAPPTPPAPRRSSSETETVLRLVELLASSDSNDPRRSMIIGALSRQTSVFEAPSVVALLKKAADANGSIDAWKNCTEGVVGLMETATYLAVRSIAPSATDSGENTGGPYLFRGGSTPSAPNRSSPTVPF